MRNTFLHSHTDLKPSNVVIFDSNALFNLISRKRGLLNLVNHSFLFDPNSYLAEDLLIDDSEIIEIKNTSIVDESKKIRKIILDIHSNQELIFQLDSRKFEELIAEILHQQGFKVELTKCTRDGGYDIRAFLKIPSQAPLKWLVECKRYTERKVGIDVVRSFKEVLQSENANRGIIATTAFFTLGAQKKQQEIPHLLDLRDKDAIMDWIAKYANSART